MIVGMEVIEADPSRNVVCIAYYNGQPYHSSAISVSIGTIKVKICCVYVVRPSVLMMTIALYPKEILSD
jgi:hypothetical protein